MVLSNNKNAKYHCRTSHMKTDFDCTSEGTLQADIHEMVVTLIRTYAAYAVSLEHLLLLQKERIQAEKKQARRGLTVLQSRKNQLEKSTQTTTEQDGAFIEKYKEYTELATLTSDIARDAVKHVTVYKDGGIEIELALRYELEKLLNCLETVNAAS